MTSVLHLQYKSSSSGDFAYRLHKEFQKAGINSNILTLYSDDLMYDHQSTIGKKGVLISKLDNFLHSIISRDFNSNYGYFSYPILGSNLAKHNQVRNADIIYIHWVLRGFLNIRGINKLAGLNKPIIFVLHDMWAITGGCHNSFSCEKYLSKCTNCQLINGTKQNDLSTSGFQKKLKLYSKFDNIYFVAPSRWMFDRAKESGLTKYKPIYHIPNVLDRSLFKKVHKETAKKILNLNPDHTIIGFGATSVDNPYKGWSLLMDTMKLLKSNYARDNVTILVFGKGNATAVSKAIPFKTRMMGQLNDEESMVVLYNALDLFIAPSLADNLPYTIFEALSCGTPVVATHVGGIPDLIIHKKNGYLSKYKNPADLANGIKYCLDNKIKGYVPEEMDNTKTIRRHQELIHSIIK